VKNAFIEGPYQEYNSELQNQASTIPPQEATPGCTLRGTLPRYNSELQNQASIISPQEETPGCTLKGTLPRIQLRVAKPSLNHSTARRNPRLYSDKIPNIFSLPKVNQIMQGYTQLSTDMRYEHDR
jgi:hypothetical protein